LGKRKEPEGSKTKAGTKDITSFFAPKRQQVAAVAISCSSEVHNDHIASGSADATTFALQRHEETQGTAVGLSSSALNALAKLKAREILQGEGSNDSVSQVGGESSAAGSLAAHRKRNSKAATKSIISEASNKSFGNALKGTPGTIFLINGVSFTVLNEKNSGGNRMVLC
jgi:hypothetical protein